jgi:hypothetical protein
LQVVDPALEGWIVGTLSYSPSGSERLPCKAPHTLYETGEIHNKGIRSRVEGDRRTDIHLLAGGRRGAVLAAIGTRGDAAHQGLLPLLDGDELLHRFLATVLSVKTFELLDV